MRGKFKFDVKKLFYVVFVIVLIRISLPYFKQVGERIYTNLYGKTVTGYVSGYDVEDVEFRTRGGGTSSYKVYTPLISMNNEDGNIQLNSGYNSADEIMYKEGDTLEMKYINNDLVTAKIADPFYIYSEIVKITSGYGLLGLMFACVAYDRNKEKNKLSCYSYLSEERALKLKLKGKITTLLLLTPGLINAIVAIGLNNSYYSEKSFPTIFYIIFLGVYMVAFGNLIFNIIKLKRAKELD